jgi:hypothetical protein
MDWSIMSMKDRKDAVTGIIDASQNGVTAEQIADKLKGLRMNISSFRILHGLLRTLEHERKIKVQTLANSRDELYFPRR